MAFEGLPTDAVAVLPRHGDSVYTIGVSPDSHWLVSGSGDDTVSLWSIPGARRLSDLRSCSAGPSPSILVPRATLGPFPDTPAEVAFSSDGQYFALCCYDGTIRVYAMSRWAASAAAAADRSAPDGSGSGSEDGEPADSSGDGEVEAHQVVSLPGAGTPLWLRWHPRGAALLVGYDSGLAAVVDAQKGRVLNTLRGHRGPVTAGGFTGDGKRVVTGGADGTVRLIHPLTGQLESGAGLARDGAPLHPPSGDEAGEAPEDVVGPLSGGVVCLDIAPRWASPSLSAAVHGGYGGQGPRVRAPTRVVTGGSDGRAVLVVLSGTRARRAMVYEGHEAGIEKVKFAPGSSAPMLATAGLDATARVWDLDRDRPSQTLVHPGGQPVTGLAWDPCPGRPFLYTACADGTARAWDIRAGTLVRAWRGPNDVPLVLTVWADPRPSDIRASTDPSILPRVWLAIGGEDPDIHLFSVGLGDPVLGAPSTTTAPRSMVTPTR